MWDGSRIAGAENEVSLVKTDARQVQACAVSGGDGRGMGQARPL
jgi:hypothetical protein